MKKDKTKNMGRPLLYGEQTFVFSGFHCPVSKKKEMTEYINKKLKSWEVSRENTKNN